ncbi:MAG: hypothetical protein AAGB34_03000 [Planctomycetota bacterium]
MRIRWVKADGCGNICLYAWAHEGDDRTNWSRVGSAMCSSYNADVLMLVDQAESAEAPSIQVINADGSDGGLCINGLRCYAVVSDAKDWTKVRCGNLEPLVRMEGNTIGAVRESVTTVTEHLQDKQWFVDLGNPHVIVPVEDVAGCQLTSLAKQINAEAAQRTGPWQTSRHWHTGLQAGVNVHAIGTVIDGTIEARPHERGCGETGACGSGAIAIAIALREQGQIDHEVEVRMPGGRLDVRFVDGNVEIRGSAIAIAEGWFEM